MSSRPTAQVQPPQLSGRFTRSFTPLVVLQACHIAELTGTLRARSGARLVTVGFDSGEIAAAEALDGGEGLEALTALAEWTDGSFDFHTGAPPAGTNSPGPFNWLMLEVCRRADEERAFRGTGGPPPGA